MTLKKIGCFEACEWGDDNLFRKAGLIRNLLKEGTLAYTTCQ